MNNYPDIGLDLKDKEKNIFLNSDNETLINKAVELGHGILSKTGSLVVETGFFTGRAAKDKYVVKNKETEHTIWWENSLNEMSEETFESLKIKAIDYLNKQENLFITERSVGAHSIHNIGARLISNRPSAALFSNHLFREKMREFDQRDFTILHVPGLEIDPEKYSDLRSKTVITTCFEKKITIIIGTYYAGEIKKSMFSVLNYLLPDQEFSQCMRGPMKEKKKVLLFSLASQELEKQLFQQMKADFLSETMNTHFMMKDFSTLKVVAMPKLLNFLKKRSQESGKHQTALEICWKMLS